MGMLRNKTRGWRRSKKTGTISTCFVPQCPHTPQPEKLLSMILFCQRAELHSIKRKKSKAKYSFPSVSAIYSSVQEGRENKKGSSSSCTVTQEWCIKWHINDCVYFNDYLRPAYLWPQKPTRFEMRKNHTKLKSLQGL